MQNFQDTFETRKGSIISGFSIFMTVPLRETNKIGIIYKIFISALSSTKQHSYTDWSKFLNCHVRDNTANTTCIFQK